MKRFALGIILAASLVACGGGQHLAYRPIAFGQGGHCYYAQDPGEVLALQRAGLCDPTWTPLLMPPAWHQMYYPYYSSPAYVRSYVPAPSRSVYVDRERSFGSSNRSAIDLEAKKATYLGSNGKTVSAEKIGVAKYGAGNRFGPVGTKFGGGARNATPSPAPSPGAPGGVAPPKTPSSPAHETPTPKAPAPSKSFGGGARNGGSSGHVGGSHVGGSGTGGKTGGFGGGSRGGGYSGGSHSFGGGHR
jgi:hypothetical protein